MATRLAALATVLLICQLWRRTESKYIATEACSVRLLKNETSILHVFSMHAIAGAGCIHVRAHDDFR